MDWYAQLYTDTEVNTDKEWNIQQEIFSKMVHFFHGLNGD